MAVEKYILCVPTLRTECLHMHCDAVNHNLNVSYIYHIMNTWLVVFEFRMMRKNEDNMELSNHYCDVIMGAMAYQITSLTIDDSTIHSDPDRRRHQISASLAFMRGLHPWPVNSPHKWSVSRKMFPFDDVIMPNPNVVTIVPAIILWPPAL